MKHENIATLAILIGNGLAILGLLVRLFYLEV